MQVEVGGVKGPKRQAHEGPGLPARVSGSLLSQHPWVLPTGSPQWPNSLRSRAHAPHPCSHVPSQLPLLLWVSRPAATSLPKAVSLIPPHCPLSYSRPSPTSQSPVPLRGPPTSEPWPMDHPPTETHHSTNTFIKLPVSDRPILSQQAISGDVRILTMGNLEPSVSVSISKNLPLPMVPRLAAVWKPRGSFYPKNPQLQEKMGMRSATEKDRKSRRQAYPRKTQLKGVLLSGEVDGGYLQEMGSIQNSCMLSHFSCLTLCDPMDCSPPGSSVQGILQARILEWAAISFSTETGM